MENTTRHLTIKAPLSKSPETWETCVGKVVKRVGYAVGSAITPKNKDTTFISGNKTLH